MRQRGFTLIEIIVVVAILAMIMMMTMPSVASWQENTRIRNMADSLQSGLQLARGEAVSRNKEVSFSLVALADPSTMGNECSLSATSGSWVVSVASPEGHCADAPSASAAPKIISTRAAGYGPSVKAVQFSDSNLPGKTVTFNGFGRVVNSDAIGMIDIRGGTDAINLHVVLSAAGQVRICDMRVGDSNDPRHC